MFLGFIRRAILSRISRLRTREFWGKVAVLAGDVLENRKTVDQGVEELIAFHIS